jgi:hypothetical protein
MEYFYFYCLFAVTTSLTALYELVWPVLRKRKKWDPKPIQNKWILVITLFLLMTLAAPLVFFSCIIPEWGQRFRETLYKALFEEAKL